MNTGADYCGLFASVAAGTPQLFTALPYAHLKLNGGESGEVELPHDMVQDKTICH